MVSESVSRINIVLEIIGKSKISCQLFRHLSPKTVGIISRSMPIQGNAHHIGTSIVYLGTRVDSGIERRRTNFKKGDIAFLPTGGCICFCTSDINSGQPMTPIGKIITNIENFTEVKTGDILLLYSETL
jgi:hypothetical protein